MLIKIDEGINLLREENNDLKRQMDSCNTQISNINKALDESRMLQGTAYDALRERISMRPNILKAHYISYDSLMSANSENMQALSELPQTSAGILDTSVSDDRIDYAQKQIWYLEQRRDSAIARLKSNPLPTDDLGISWSYSRTRAINAIYNTYESLINAQHAVITKETETKNRASQYDSYSATIYARVNDDLQNFLVPSDASVVQCLKTGSYAGTTGWVSGANKKYNRQKKLRDVLDSGLLTDDEYRKYKRALMNSDDGNITEEQLYDDEFNSDLYKILEKLSGRFVSDKEIQAIEKVFGKISDNGDKEAFQIAFPDVDVNAFFNAWRQASQESKSALASNLGAQFWKNLGSNAVQEKLASQISQTLSEFIRVFNPIPVKQAATVIGTSVDIVDSSSIRAMMGGAAKAAPFIGCGIDITMQVAEGEQLNHAVNKGVVHAGISAAVVIGAGVLLGNPIGLAGVAVFATTAIVGTYISVKFDEWYDSKFK